MEGYKIDKALFTKAELQDVLAGLRGIDSVSKGSTLVSWAKRVVSFQYYYEREIPEEKLSLGDYLSEGNIYLKDLFNRRDWTIKDD